MLCRPLNWYLPALALMQIMLTHRQRSLMILIVAAATLLIPIFSPHTSINMHVCSAAAPLPAVQCSNPTSERILYFVFFSVSCRVRILAKARSRVRAGSAQRQAARPVWVGEMKDFIQGRRIDVCWSRHGPGTS